MIFENIVVIVMTKKGDPMLSTHCCTASELAVVSSLGKISASEYEGEQSQYTRRGLGFEILPIILVGLPG